MPDLIVTRMSAEIFAHAQAADDFLGWAREVLLPYCDYETALPLLNEGVTAEDWFLGMNDPAKVGEAARDYYEFALGKIADERGISAERSVIKLREYAWLMGRDDVVAAMDEAPYPMYGAPKVAVFGEAFGFAAEAVPMVCDCGRPLAKGIAFCSPGCRLADKDHGPDEQLDGGES